MKEMLRELGEAIAKHHDEAPQSLLFETDVAHKQIELSKENFHHLEKTTHAGEIYFIDGGSSEIISSHAFSLLFIRTAYVSYQNFTKTKSDIKEYFVFSKVADKKITITVHPVKGTSTDAFSFSLADETLASGKQFVSAATAAHTIRRFFELRLGAELAKQANKGDMIVLDGSLHAMVTGEKQELDAFLSACKAADVLACALSKTTKLMSENGIPLTLTLARMADGLQFPEKRWFYHPLTELSDPNYPAELFITKLHPLAKHQFVFELFKDQRFVSVDKVLGALALTAQDPVFLGYPYGLIKVDELARVTHDEISYMRMRLSQHVNIEELEEAVSAHKILDSIKF